ncbi:MAG: PIN domain-containing protein [Cyanobium sp. M30B3]|nr:MAG: PIN domain-containing protein [Cyanobium sp. M30B3]
MRSIRSWRPSASGDCLPRCQRLDRFEALFAQPDLLVVDLSGAVVERATQLRATHGLRTPDALQAACCLQLGPGAVMITGDAGFQRLQAL